MRTLKFAGSIVLVSVGTLLLQPSPASAQGCILLRQTSPLFGASGGDQQPGTWNITFTGRNSTADKHYNGTERQMQREI